MVIQIRQGWNGKPPRVRGRFTYRDSVYDLPVTDPKIEDDYKKDHLVGKEHFFGQCFVTVSLAAKPYEKDDCHYTLIAAIVTSDCGKERTR